MTEQEKKEFERWHEHRLNELAYPQELANELRLVRVKWLASVKVKK